MPPTPVAQAFGALKAAKSVLRSHVIIGKGGKLLSVENGISPGDSFAQAADFVAAHKQGSGSNGKAEAAAAVAGDEEAPAEDDPAKETGDEQDGAQGEGEDQQAEAAPKKGKGRGKKK